MDSLALVLDIGKTTLVFFIGTFLALRFIPFKRLLPYTGRLNRTQFAMRYIPFIILLHIIYSTIDTMILSSIVAPSYWFWKSMFWLVTTLSTPFYLSFLNRRFLDMGIPTTAGLVWTYINLFCNIYAVLPYIKFITTLFLGLGLIFLLFMPGIPESRAKRILRSK